MGAVPPASGRPRVLLVGDSGAALLGEGMVDAGEALEIDVVARGTVGCGIARASDGVTAPDGSFLPDPPGCDDWDRRWAQDVRDVDPDVSILFLAWAGIGDREVDGEPRHPCDPAFDRYYQGELEAALDVLSEGGDVLLATVPYVVDASEFDDRVDCLNAVHRAAVRSRGDQATAIADLAAWVCPQGQCRAEVDGDVLRPDGVHFEGRGAVRAGRWLLEATDLVSPTSG